MEFSHPQPKFCYNTLRMSSISCRKKVEKKLQTGNCSFTSFLDLRLPSCYASKNLNKSFWTEKNIVIFLVYTYNAANKNFIHILFNLFTFLELHNFFNTSIKVFNYYQYNKNIFKYSFFLDLHFYIWYLSI